MAKMLFPRTKTVLTTYHDGKIVNEVEVQTAHVHNETVKVGQTTDGKFLVRDVVKYEVEGPVRSASYYEWADAQPA